MQGLKDRQVYPIVNEKECQGSTTRLQSDPTIEMHASAGDHPPEIETFVGVVAA